MWLIKQSSDAAGRVVLWAKLWLIVVIALFTTIGGLSYAINHNHFKLFLAVFSQEYLIDFIFSVLLVWFTGLLMHSLYLSIFYIPSSCCLILTRNCFVSSTHPSVQKMHPLWHQFDLVRSGELYSSNHVCGRLYWSFGRWSIGSKHLLSAPLAQQSSFVVLFLICFVQALWLTCHYHFETGIEVVVSDFNAQFGVYWGQ